MAETTQTGHEEGLEKAEMAQFIPEGVDRIQLPDGGILTIMRGRDEHGAEGAMVSVMPPELLLPEKDDYKIKGIFQTIRDAVLWIRERFPRVAAGLTMAGGAMVALQGCGYNGPDAIGGNLGVQTMALTVPDLVNLGQPQAIQWSVAAVNNDMNPNIATINGKKVILFKRAVQNPLGNKIFYVDCDQIEQCLGPNKVPQQIAGLPLDSYQSAIIYQHQDGSYKIIAKGGETFQMNIGYDANNNLTASGQPVLPPFGFGTADDMAHYELNGVPYVATGGVGALGTTNLDTGETVVTQLNGGAVCGAPHFEGSAVASFAQTINQIQYCKLYVAPTLQELINGFPVMLNQYEALGVTKVKSPRIVGNILIYSALHANGHKLWYAVVQPYCTDGACNGNETPQSCPQDCPVIPPDGGEGEGEVDGGEGEGEVDGGEGEVDGGEGEGEVDGGEGEGEVDGGEGEGEVDGDGEGEGEVDGGGEGEGEVDGGDGGEGEGDGGDGGEGEGEGEGGPDIPPDNGEGEGEVDGGEGEGDPDIPPIDQCAAVKQKIAITTGSCDLTNCEPQYADVVGDCTFSVNLGNANPATIEIDGAYGIDFFEKIGAFLYGKYKVVDSGNNLPTNYGSFETAVDGTVYGGEGEKVVDGAPQTYKVWCSEGRISVSYNGQPLATIDGDPDAAPITFVDGAKQDEDAGGGDGGPDGGPDGGQPDGGPTQPDTGNGSPDTGRSPDNGESPDAGPSVDANTPPKKTPPADTGCNCTVYGNNETSGGTLALFGLMLLAIAARMRRKSALKPAKVAIRD